MTIREREEDREKASNPTIEQIKEKEEEEEELDQIKKEEDDEELNLDRPLNVRNGFNEVLDTILNEIVKESESSMKEMEEHEEKESKRTRIAESEEAETAQVRIGSDPAMDPLDTTMEIVSKYHDFVDFVLEMLEEEQEYEEEMKIQRWSEVVERGKHLVESLKQRLQRLPDELERMKNDENLQEEYFNRKHCIGHILPQVRDINSRIDRSPHISIVSGVNVTVRVLPLCLDELQYSKVELFAMMELIRDVKEGNEEEEYLDEDEYEQIIAI